MRECTLNSLQITRKETLGDQSVNSVCGVELMVEVIWCEHEIPMFAQDIRARGEKLESAG
jgi:hypothetical protein